MPYCRQSFQRAHTSVGAGSAGHWIKMAGILSPLILGELIQDADKRWRWVRICGGKCTFTPEMTTQDGRIVICDFPLLEYGHETGRLINVILKLIFQRAWLMRKLSDSPNPVFLWQDEFQYFVTRRDNFFQQTCRGSRVAVICLTQNILNLSEELGEDQPGSKTKSFLGNLGLNIFHQQKRHRNLQLRGGPDRQALSFPGQLQRRQRGKQPVTRRRRRFRAARSHHRAD